MMITFPAIRPRRLRQNPHIRTLIRETQLSITDFILPLFIKADVVGKQPIVAMPGHFQLSLEALKTEIQEIVSLGIPGVILFGIPTTKDATGSSSYAEKSIVSQAIGIIKNSAPNLLVITDVCLCEYTDHGHCGVIEQRHGQYQVNNDATLALLVKQAVHHVQAGADIVAPSCMMDGMVGAVRQGLDQAGLSDIPVLSYAVKYASALYGPFRAAAESAPSFGDRRGYQMDAANSNEALREVLLDMNEGADILMVKPAGAYLDIIYRIKQQYPFMPIAAYQVSGEFAMIKAAAAQGWIEEKATALESLLAIKRAGADFILSYFTKDVARWL